MANIDEKIQDLNIKEDESRIKMKNMQDKNTLLQTFKRVSANSTSKT